jgi:hypothetical protein
MGHGMLGEYVEREGEADLQWLCLVKSRSVGVQHLQPLAAS